MRELETFRTLYCDPGEDFGWCIGRDTKLLLAGTEKMWTFADDAWDALNNPSDPSNPLNSVELARTGVTQEECLGPIGRVVCEDWRLYPEKLKHLAWDRCRTARVIGALTFMARQKQIPFVLQPAAIKKAAVAAGAEELFYRPLRENRHANDALMHFCFYTSTELMGLNMPVNAMTEEDSNAV